MTKTFESILHKKAEQHDFSEILFVTRSRLFKSEISEILFLSAPAAAKAAAKSQRNFFDFHRNVTKSIRDAQFLSDGNGQSAKSDAKETKVIHFRLIFDTERAIMNLRKRLRA